MWHHKCPSPAACGVEAAAESIVTSQTPLYVAVEAAAVASIVPSQVSLPSHMWELKLPKKASRKAAAEATDGAPAEQQEGGEGQGAGKAEDAPQAAGSEEEGTERAARLREEEAKEELEQAEEAEVIGFF